jgi:hypothetical protein
LGQNVVSNRAAEGFDEGFDQPLVSKLLSGSNAVQVYVDEKTFI